jgi:hypothetical protein
MYKRVYCTVHTPSIYDPNHKLDIHATYIYTAVPLSNTYIYGVISYLGQCPLEKNKHMRHCVICVCLSVPPFQLVNELTGFHEIVYELESTLHFLISYNQK